jgi:hypothetical protein
MELLGRWEFAKPQGPPSAIELYEGDLSRLPPEHAVDILVVSAFPNDYNALPGSLIHALEQVGVSVARLAESKEDDMREGISCWLSRPIPTTAFRRVLCIESGWRGGPLDITDDLFRALAPMALSEHRTDSVAMPVIGTGYQRSDPSRMLGAILQSAAGWFRRGMAIRVLKIVVLKRLAEMAKAELARQQAMAESPALRQAYAQQFLKTGGESLSTVRGGTLAGGRAPVEEPGGYDIFLSYSHKDTPAAEKIVGILRQHAPHLRIFYDRKALAPGDSWLLEIAEALDNSKRVAALYTPDYWSSRNCKLEFTAALTRQTDSDRQILFPIYFREARILTMFKNIQFADCREADLTKLEQVSRDLCAACVGPYSAS